jgi:hypothetical protein
MVSTPAVSIVRGVIWLVSVAMGEQIANGIQGRVGDTAAVAGN